MEFTVAKTAPEESCMIRNIAAALFALLAAVPTLARAAEPWPWVAKTPVDPALLILPKVTALTASVADKIVKVSVKAVAPQAGFSELQLTARMGNKDDRIFAFDARGRPPQQGADVETDVSIEDSYSDAPIGKLGTIEVYSKSNCLGYSLVDKAPVKCTGTPQPDAPLP
jgi:hypothetical protein